MRQLFNRLKTNFKRNWAKYDAWDRFGICAFTWVVGWAMFSICIWTPIASIFVSPWMWATFSRPVAGFFGIWLYLWPMLLGVFGLFGGLIYMQFLRDPEDKKDAKS